MTNIDRNYLLVALAWLIVGTVFGFWMGAANALDYRVIHVAMLLPGFVTLAIYGFIYRLWPRLKTSTMAIAQFWIAVVSQLFIVIGTWQFNTNGSIVVVAPASLAAIIGALMISWMFWREAVE
jgi:hypothetical protein